MFVYRQDTMEAACIRSVKGWEARVGKRGVVGARLSEVRSPRTKRIKHTLPLLVHSCVWLVHTCLWQHPGGLLRHSSRPDSRSRDRDQVRVLSAGGPEQDGQRAGGVGSLMQCTEYVARRVVRRAEEDPRAAGRMRPRFHGSM